MPMMQQEYFGATNQGGEADCCCLSTDVSEVPFASPAHLPRREPSCYGPANLTLSQGFVSKNKYQSCEKFEYLCWKQYRIQDFLNHAVYPFQTTKHLKDQWSGIYEMIYCVSDHLDTSYRWIVFLHHRKKICFYPWPKPEVIINFTTQAKFLLKT